MLVFIANDVMELEHAENSDIFTMCSLGLVTEEEVMKKEASSVNKKD